MEQTQVISRLGCFTSSEIGKLLKSGRTKDKMFGDTAMTYIMDKVAEVITGERKKQVQAVSLDWGIGNEKDAFLVFKEVMKLSDDEVIYYGAENFKYFEYNEFSGGSPDGVTTDAVIEIKCPLNSSNHIEALISARLNPGEYHNSWLKAYNPEYYAQLQWNMICCKMDYGYFVSYDPRTVDYANRIAILRITLDSGLIHEIDTRLTAAIGIVRETLQLINQVNSK